MPGYVHVYTGEGKGKTTAALGLALRAAGAGWNVFLGQFAKGTRTSELVALEQRLADRVTVRQFGLPHWIGGQPTAEDLAWPAAAWKRRRRGGHLGQVPAGDPRRGQPGAGTAPAGRRGPAGR